MHFYMNTVLQSVKPRSNWAMRYCYGDDNLQWHVVRSTRQNARIQGTFCTTDVNIIGYQLPSLTLFLTPKWISSNYCGLFTRSYFFHNGDDKVYVFVHSLDIHLKVRKFAKTRSFVPAIICIAYWCHFKMLAEETWIKLYQAGDFARKHLFEICNLFTYLCRCLFLSYIKQGN